MKEQRSEMWSLQERFQLKRVPSGRMSSGMPADHEPEGYTMNLNTIMCLPPTSEDLRLVWALVDQASDLDDNKQLIESFNKFPYPTITEISVLCVSFGLQVDKVKVWFMAQRVKYGISWSPEEIIEARSKLYQKQEQCRLQSKKTPQNCEQPSFTYEPAAQTRTSESWKCGRDTKTSGSTVPQSKSTSSDRLSLPSSHGHPESKRSKVSASESSHNFSTPSGHTDKRLQLANSGNKRPYLQQSDPTEHRPLFADLQFTDPSDKRPEFASPTEKASIVNYSGRTTPNITSTEKRPVVVDPKEKRQQFAEGMEKKYIGSLEKRQQFLSSKEKTHIPGPSEKRAQFPGSTERKKMYPGLAEKTYSSHVERRMQFGEASRSSAIARECKKEEEEVDIYDSEGGQLQEGGSRRWFRGAAGMATSESGSSMHQHLPNLGKEAFFVSTFSSFQKKEVSPDLLRDRAESVVSVTDVAVAESSSMELCASRLRNVWRPSDINGESSGESSIKRRRKTKEQLAVLKSFFLRCQWARDNDYKMLEEVTGLTRTEITRWFVDTRYALRHGQLRWFYEGIVLSPRRHGLQQSLPHSPQPLKSPSYSQGTDVDHEPLERYLSIKGQLEERDLEALCKESGMNYQQVLDWFLSRSQSTSEVVVSLSDEEDMKM
ncbi:zinc fingers and homeoboxes protein 3-like [Protopterus annectens]|uniref:zinc fingers and homeoboxes protein 3-like n=1 Tax=Protopterus annectens TaxID=7888 RepID=UPI001CFBBA8B|nr:zinc fingers and homeoboxes protein 3-like [Protopterus annectens]XP_043914171.1 zinc fingers and homeoboxes protein 3-like [Protopterus annectens]